MLKVPIREVHHLSGGSARRAIGQHGALSSSRVLRVMGWSRADAPYLPYFEDPRPPWHLWESGFEASKTAGRAFELIGRTEENGSRNSPPGNGSESRSTLVEEYSTHGRALVRMCEQGGIVVLRNFAVEWHPTSTNRRILVQNHS